jgi:2-keto-4-pentenoate hydratase/2-oxohepta-3-ene-1,7-dioic acid hydratase in catechol pathway
VKLVRFGQPGREKPGIVDAKGAVRDLSGVVPDIDARAVTPEGLAKIRKADVNGLPAVQSGARLGACVGGVRNFYAVGLNYVDHAKETGAPIPKEPILFNKSTSCIVGPNDDVMLPQNSVKSDWEVELALVIGTRARYVDEAKALSHVAGYFICNDVSEREFQIERGGQWMKGKGCETFGPIGPWLVTTDEITNPQTLDMWLDVNADRMQTGNTRTMVFSVAKIVAHVSNYMTLLPGDIITTGTPPGVGMGKKPEPIWLKPGDVVMLGIQGLGEQRQRVVAHSGK